MFAMSKCMQMPPTIIFKQTKMVKTLKFVNKQLRILILQCFYPESFSAGADNFSFWKTQKRQKHAKKLSG